MAPRPDPRGYRNGQSTNLDTRRYTATADVGCGRREGTTDRFCGIGVRRPGGSPGLGAQRTRVQQLAARARRDFRLSRPLLRLLVRDRI